MSNEVKSTFLGPHGIVQADKTFLPWQFLLMLAVIGFIAYAVLKSFQSDPGLLFYTNYIFAVFFLITISYRSYLMVLSMSRDTAMKITDKELISADRDWPAYVIQVPLYKEEKVLPELIKALSAMDYPKDKLTIQLLIEEDDDLTRSAAENADITKPFEIVLIPESYPRTKPKACNVGLASAKGDYLVIYDAEDRPEKDQLKKAVLAFEKLDSRIACLQAKLNYFNRGVKINCSLSFSISFNRPGKTQ